MDAVASTPRLRLTGPRRVLKLRSDAALADRFQAGDEAAFAVLYERHRATVLAVCMGVLGSRHDAEDAAQEAFASLALALRSEPPRELRGWLARVARNASIDLARRRRERPSEDHLDDQASPGHTGKAELETVLAGIRQLPESQRTALLMRELAGHSYLEIANLLDTDEDGVRGLIARARVGLRNYREAVELPCVAARAALCAEPDRRRVDKTARRHLRSCPACRAYQQALRSDAQALRGLAPVQGTSLLGGGAAAGLAAKGALAGVAATQVGAACAVSICALGGFALLYQPGHRTATHHSVVRGTPALRPSGNLAVSQAAAQSPLAPGARPTAGLSQIGTPPISPTSRTSTVGSHTASQASASGGPRPTSSPVGSDGGSQSSGGGWGNSAPWSGPPRSPWTPSGGNDGYGADNGHGRGGDGGQQPTAGPDSSGSNRGDSGGGGGYGGRPEGGWAGQSGGSGSGSGDSTPPASQSGDGPNQGNSGDSGPSGGGGSSDRSGGSSSGGDRGGDGGGSSSGGGGSSRHSGSNND